MKHKTFKQLGRGRRCPDVPSDRLLKEVQFAERQKRLAERNFRETVRRARAAGLYEEDDVPANPDFKVRRNGVHIYPGGLDDPTHGHVKITLAGELSTECIAELREKVTNGRVTFDRDYRVGDRWCVVSGIDDTSMAAD